MTKGSSDNAQLQYKNAGLPSWLEEAGEIPHAIHCGKVDTLVISNEGDEGTFTFKEADDSFRLLVENMNEGALTMTGESMILYANQRFAEMLKTPLEKVIGSSLIDWVMPADREIFQALLHKEDDKRHLAGVTLVNSGGTLIPAQLSLINHRKLDNICVVVTDLTEHNRIEDIINAERLARFKCEESECFQRALLSLVEGQKRVEEALRKSEQWLAEELNAAEHLQKLSTQLLEADNVDELYDKILDTTMEILRSDCASLQLFHPERGAEGDFYLLKHSGFEYAAKFWEQISPRLQSTCSMVLNTRTRVAIPDLRQCSFMAGSSDLETYLHAGILAVQTTPLLSRTGTLLGVFSTFWREPHQLTATEIRSLDVLARQVADLIEHKQIEAALKKAQEELEHKVAERTFELARANEALQQEINERLLVEKALQESEVRYRSLVENANEAIVVIQDNLIKFANPMAEQIFACSADKLASFSFRDFVHPEDRYFFRERPQKRSMGVKLENPFNFRLMALDGSVKLIMETSVKIEWEGRSAILAILTDITEAKKMEEEILKADKLDSIGVLAGGIAHDFNNYLAVLLANITLAKVYKDDPEKILEKLENMEKATLHAKDLANQLFTFAKGGAPIKEKVFIKQLIVDNIKFTLSGSNIRPNFFIAEDLNMVEADEGQLSQVLNNIVINAVQAMPEGGVLEIRAENITLNAAGQNSFVPLPEGPYVKITIKDVGMGIPEKYLSKIFDPFFTTKDKGRGLGLATSYSIIKNHGGHLGVESEMGVGTSFYIFLPAIVQVGINPAATETIPQGTGRILIMDDEDDLLAVTGEALTTLGYNVSLARNAEKAIELYMHSLNNKNPFDLVILDLTIPGGMGGKQTLKELLKKDPQVKAIVVSGYSSDPVMANFRDYGFKGALKKPFTIEDLSKIVSNIMRSSP